MTVNTNIIDNVINNDLCIGCGMCVYICDSKALELHWNEYGFLVPILKGKCTSNNNCVNVCPFYPFPKEMVETENKIADIFINDSNFYHPKIGKYIGIYAGYAKEFRLTSSSGGIATFVFSQLLKNGFVEHVFSVIESTKPDTLYEYSVCNSMEELIKASKTKYYPVTLASVFNKIHDLPGKVAIVGVACFIKAIRLAQNENHELKEKIPFLAGIICGGVKSRFFTEYLAGKAGVKKENILNPQFRIKNFNSSASDYSFSCYDKNDKQEKSIRMRTVGDMWGTSFFKANACDFCDDVTAELADISLGDAWLQPFSKDGKGTNVIVTRSAIAEELIRNGIIEDKLVIEELSLERFLASQQGSFNHRHNGLSTRIKKAKKENRPIPPKRFGNEKVNLYFKLVQNIRMNIRRESLEIWENNPDAILFDKKINRRLWQLKKATTLYHYYQAANKRMRKLFFTTTHFL